MKNVTIAPGLPYIFNFCMTLFRITISNILLAWQMKSAGRPSTAGAFQRFRYRIAEPVSQDVSQTVDHCIPCICLKWRLGL